MGHDITAFKAAVKDAEEGTKADEIAYFRYNAFNPSNRTLYELLDATEFYAGWSGNGDGRLFSKGEIEAALVRLDGRMEGGTTEIQRESEFLHKLLAYLAAEPDETHVYIDFG